MSNSGVITQPLSPNDKAILGKLRDKALFAFFKLYLPLFLLLVLVYYKMQPGNTFRGNRISYTKDQFETVFPWFALFFGLVFLFFAFRDFRRMILPLLKEMKRQQKNCLTFSARKYHDPIYDKRLLFYPEKEDVYIEVGQEDFDAIGNGESLQLEVGCVTGEVLLLRSQGRVFKEPAEFSFSDRSLALNNAYEVITSSHDYRLIWYYLSKITSRILPNIAETQPRRVFLRSYPTGTYFLLPKPD